MAEYKLKYKGQKIDELLQKIDDMPSTIVSLEGDQTIAGSKRFTSDMYLDAETYIKSGLGINFQDGDYYLRGVQNGLSFDGNINLNDSNGISFDRGGFFNADGLPGIATENKIFISGGQFSTDQGVWLEVPSQDGKLALIEDLDELAKELFSEGENNAKTNVNNEFSKTQTIRGQDDTPLNLIAKHASDANIAFYNNDNVRLGNIGCKNFKPYWWGGDSRSTYIVLQTDLNTVDEDLRYNIELVNNRIDNLDSQGVEYSGIGQDDLGETVDEALTTLSQLNYEKTNQINSLRIDLTALTNENNALKSKVEELEAQIEEILTKLGM